MAQCKGETLKGDRCKREARPGSGFCSIHEDQAPAGGSREPLEWDADALLKTAVGFAILGAIVLFRIKR